MTDIPLNDLGRGVEEHATEIRAAIEGVLTSGWYVHGARHGEFESALATFVGTRHAIGVASGTDALVLALRACAASGVVVTAANAGGYTSVAAHRAGLVPVYADVDPDTHLLDHDAVESVLDARDDVTAVVITHLYGRMADVEDLVSRCRPRGVRVVEDCAQSIGAVRRGRGAGAIGDLGTFSFYPTKNLGALGDGGAVTTDDDELAAKVTRLRQYGWSSKYVVTDMGGINSRLDELQAAILAVRLPHVRAWNTRRRDIIAAYAAAADDRLRVLPATGQEHTGHLAVAESADRDAMLDRLRGAGIGVDVHYPVPDHLQLAWTTDVSLPVTERLAGRVLSLPCFPQLTDAEVQRVCDVIAAPS